MKVCRICEESTGEFRFYGRCPHSPTDTNFLNVGGPEVNEELKHTTHFDDCGCLSAAYKAALQAKDAEIAELKAKNDLLETQLACAADLANTWARESGVMECDNPYFGLFLRDLISRLWGKLSSRYIAELGRSEKLVEVLLHSRPDKEWFYPDYKTFYEFFNRWEFYPDYKTFYEFFNRWEKEREEALAAHRKPEEAGKP